MTSSIAIVGMACRYPDARSTAELWENVLTQRRAFRRMPKERLRLEDYQSDNRQAPDRTYATEAAVIEGYEFDRLRYRVVGSTFRSADITHWLALDIAAAALEDAGFADGEGLPREETAVVLGNTLTGEFSRANVMRLRWPYVRRVVDAALTEQEWSQDRRRDFLRELEASYKSPFPETGEETLAGGLSNTIAGRICNHFDLKGGGYTVNGACSSSLLAITTACTSLVSGDVDVVLVGGVDSSLDPFELVGFAKTGALAADEMRVYDARSAGFWPGEGCGFAVLMREADAVEQQKSIYALIRGWGVSSDGSGGITRPEVDGQILALKRAYKRAGMSADQVAYFEGHGTGTAVGDETELRVLSQMRRHASSTALPAAIGSIKANIGHTKAAAGIAGFIKATMAVQHRVLPPTTGCGIPHSELARDDAALRILRQPESWPADARVCAGVSAMGFGGINTHIVLEGPATARRDGPGPEVVEIRRTAQDAEIFFFSARSRKSLGEQAARLIPIAEAASRAEIIDLAAHLAEDVADEKCRAAIVAATPQELAVGLRMLSAWIDEGVRARLDPGAGVFLGRRNEEARIGFLFPGQGSPAHLDGGAMRRRFAEADATYEVAALPGSGDGIATEVAQPAIVTASSAALRMFEHLGIKAIVGVGHSLGELAALHWGGAMDAHTLLRVARARGRAMADLGSPTGAMAGIRADGATVESLIEDSDVVVAGINSPNQTVISGPAASVEEILVRAQHRDIVATMLPVSHAFHSDLVAAATPALQRHLQAESFESLGGQVCSTITGAVLANDEDLVELLCRQVTSPVRFTEALERAASQVDLLIEVGPGEVLSRLAAQSTETPIVATDAGGASLSGILKAVGASFAVGADVGCRTLFADRFTRPFDPNHQPSFFVSPCELAPAGDGQIDGADFETGASEQPSDAAMAAASPLELVRHLVATRTELPPDAIAEDSRLLSDLHLNSISVGQIVTDAARLLDLPAPTAPTAFANATVADIGVALEDWARQAGSTTPAHTERQPPGVESWIRGFTVQLVERPLVHRHHAEKAMGWRVLAAEDHPLRAKLTEAFGETKPGGGVVVCLSAEPNEHEIPLLLESAKAMLADKSATRFVVVQHGWGGTALAKTLQLEQPDFDVCVVNVPVNHPDALEWILDESASVVGYCETHYDTAGVRREPLLVPLPELGEPEALALSGSDVLLVTGGGKGIAFQCALTIARETGVRLALLGRSDPLQDNELAENLDRMSRAGVDYRYIMADVCCAEAVRAAVVETESELGPITAFWHAAGINKPQLLDTLDESAFRNTVRPKLDGANNVLTAVSPDKLRQFVSFGSIIAQAGMSGEADYAVANDWLARLTEDWQAEHPHCHCVAIEWSVWASIGMGKRLGRVESLMQQGVTPIPTDEGLRWLRRLIGRPLPAVRVTVAGRFGRPPTVRMAREDLPLRRFLERAQVDYPGIEIVVDSDLSAEADPYVNDHVLQGERLFPAVMGLEAMSQVALALSDTTAPPVFEDVRFQRPIVVPARDSITIRVAALQRPNGRIDVALRSSTTGFQVDHFSCTCLADPEPGDAPLGMPQPTWLNGNEAVAIDPRTDIYGGILFHSGRFQRLRKYFRLKARECVAEISPALPTSLFGHYLPVEMVLGDPAGRDTAIHAIQTCIPHARLLPVSVDRIRPRFIPSSSTRYVHAVETSREGDIFTYNMDVIDAEGQLLERWESLRLQVLEPLSQDAGWTPALLGPYAERRVNELVGQADISVVLEQNGNSDRRERSGRAIQRATGKPVDIDRREDGKPEVAGGPCVSASHAGDLTLAVCSGGSIGCDIETVETRAPAAWKDLLGADRFTLAELISKESGEEIGITATRIWSAGECLKKAGAASDAPLVYADSTDDGWVLLRSGGTLTATYVAAIQGEENKLVTAVSARDSSESV